MIPVQPQPEPPDFDTKVRQKGQHYLASQSYSLVSTTELPPYWRDCLDDLHAAYHGVCAYLAIYMERIIGGASVDHFVAKSKRIELAYEWNNYRLACSVMNSRKRDYEDVLDPFEISQDWFFLNLVSGQVYPNPAQTEEIRQAVESTIQRLALNRPQNCETRARHFQEYCFGEVEARFLQKRSPFVYREAHRQNLL